MRKTPMKVFILVLALLVITFAGLAVAQEQQTTPNDGFVEIDDGALIHYQISGEGEPMLLLHGYPLSGELFTRVRDTLDDQYRVITIDHRGYGESLAPSIPASIERYAQDALIVMDALEVPEAIIGGMSMGGPIAFEMYQRAPERFTAMMLIDTVAAPASIVEAALWRGFAEMAAVKGVASLVPVLMKDMLSGDTRVTPPDISDTLAAIIENASVQAAVGGAYALANRPDYTDLLSQIDVPTLILVGVEDTIYPVAISRSMHEAIPTSTLALIPSAAHAAIYEAPEQAAQVILEWAGGATGSTAPTQMPATPEAAAQNLQNLLTQGIDTVPTPEAVTAFQNLQTNIQDDSKLQVVAVAIEPVESALTAEPFDQAVLVEALQNLALAMRTAADAGDAALTVELASLVDQTAAFIQNEGFTPRMEVDTP